MIDPRVLDALIDSGTAALRIPIEDAWRDAIRFNLDVSLNFGRLVEEFALPDEAEPAPVFRA